MATAASIDLTFKLRPKQRAFVESTFPFTMYVGGVGAGKSHAGVVRTLIYTATHPRSLGAIYAPTYKMLKDATQRTLFDLMPDGMIKSFNKNDQELRLFNDAEILFRSTDDPKSLRGPNLAWFWMDEAPYSGYFAWDLLKARLRQMGFNPVAWATGTPRGKDGFWESFESPLTKLPGHALFRASTLENAINLPPGYVQSLHYEGEFYQQEILGLFTAFEGLVYQFEADMAVADTHVRRLTSDIRFVGMCGGVDWGYTNPAVAGVFGIDGDDRAWQLAEWYRRHSSLERDFIPAIVELARLFGVTDWYCDPSRPDSIQALNDALDEAMLDSQAHPANNDIISGLQTVQAHLARRGDGTRGLYVDPSCYETIKEFGTYQYPKRESLIRNPDEKPLKQADHCLDMVRYCLVGYFGEQGRRAIPMIVSRAYMDPQERAIVEAIEAKIPIDDEEAARLARRRAFAARFLQRLDRDPFSLGRES